jgi:uncharacterized protein (DUF58 family)
MLFDESTLRKLNQLSLVATRVRAGAMKGERRSSRRGSSVEFADYRNYAPGDDLRRLDWNIYARLARPFIKLFEEEEDLAVAILIDGSRSMDWGEGDANKFQYALRLAAGLGTDASPPTSPPHADKPPCRACSAFSKTSKRAARPTSTRPSSNIPSPRAAPA